MKTTNDKKLSVLCILEILKKYTDENHSLTYAQIREKLQVEYGYSLDNKTIAKFVAGLQENGCDIVKKGNYGCALISRKLDNSELSFLVDAIFSSKIISSNHAKSLIENLVSDFSIYDRKKYDYIHKANEIARVNNGEFFFNIDIISRAIEAGKQISFIYNEITPSLKLKSRHDGKEFLINPYFMINSHGKYYLICNYDKYNTLSIYKIEFISNIKILDTAIKPMQSLDDTENFDLTTYVNEHVYMFGGKTIEAKIKIANSKILNDVVDWYGENIIVKEKNGEIFVTFNVNEQAFLYWALQYGLNIEIIKPISTREKYIKMLDEIMKKYGCKQ